mmetsp:Transcript_45102/g.78750  ORF Transcript_45102/g.78750 Transcript_45102/m.78750 type:complete len:324 (-) Transcript_45102:1100-2071(-)
MKEQSALPVAHCLPGTVVAESSPGIRRARAASVGVRHRRAGPTGGRGSAVTAATGSATTSATSSAAAATTVAVVLTVILGTEALAASASATATSATAAREAEAVAHALKPLGHLLVVLREELDQLLGDVAVLVVHQGQRVTHVADTAGTTNAVHVVVNVGGQVEVDHLCDIGNIQTSGRHIGGYEDGGAAGLKPLQGVLTLALGLVAVDGGSREVVSHEHLLQVVGTALGLDEHKHKALGHAAQELNDEVHLLVLFHPLNALSDVLGGSTHTAYCQEDVVLHEITSQALDLHGEGCGEHKGLSVDAHAFLLHDTTNLGLETHI